MSYYHGPGNPPEEEEPEVSENKLRCVGFTFSGLVTLAVGSLLYMGHKWMTSPYKCENIRTYEDNDLCIDSMGIARRLANGGKAVAFGYDQVTLYHFLLPRVLSVNCFSVFFCIG